MTIPGLLCDEVPIREGLFVAACVFADLKGYAAFPLLPSRAAE